MLVEWWSGGSLDVSVYRALRRRGAAELKALSLTRRRVRCANSSEFVAERRLVYHYFTNRMASAVAFPTFLLFALPLHFPSWPRSYPQVQLGGLAEYCTLPRSARSGAN